MKTVFLGITAFLGGFCIMGLELLGFRLFAPTFGYSSYVWGSLIGIILAALSIGYVFGGRIADRSMRAGTPAALLYKFVLAAGCYLFVMLLLYRGILEFSYLKLGTIFGSMFATCLIYGPPMVLLSMVSPFIIRLLTVQQKAGSIAGGIYGISNTGSILGTFLTAFVLIRVLGSHLTLILLSSIILAVGLVGLVSHSRKNLQAGTPAVHRKWLVSLIVVAIAPFSFPRRAENLLHRRESFYNDLRVLKREDGRMTLSVNRWTSYSVALSEKEGYLTGRSYYDYFNAAALLTEPREILVLGMGAGTSVKQYLHFFPEANIEAVEIDPEIIRIAKDKRYFGVEEGPRLRIFAADARPFLSKTEKKYDVIEVDMFQGGPYVPFYVTSKEFFKSAAEHLQPNGVMMMNVLSLSDNWTLLCSIEKTIKAASFPTVLTVRVGRSSNYLLIGLKQKVNVPGEVSEILREKMGAHGELRRTINDFIDSIVFLPELEEARVFTDDKSDVERVTFEMVDKYVREIPLKE